ncbi:hypothetical protein [uncultured Duncaniella sp.]|uniref:hypothetical protein n=1 Tax=uncultured Duncaniella sp. TaxID=2768039 RepID=UPI00260C315E|nr:hypothetical protein [uncultured Duncaniella sp.]
MKPRLMECGTIREQCLYNIAVICAEYGFEVPSELIVDRYGAIVIWRPHSFKELMTSLPWVRGFAHLWDKIVHIRANRRIIRDWIRSVYSEYHILTYLTPMGHLYVSCAQGVELKNSVLHQWVAISNLPYRTSIRFWR